jgi:hypothetical protein
MAAEEVIHFPSRAQRSAGPSPLALFLSESVLKLPLSLKENSTCLSLVFRRPLLLVCSDMRSTAVKRNRTG